MYCFVGLQALMLMKNLSFNLLSPEFEDHVSFNQSVTSFLIGKGLCDLIRNLKIVIELEELHFGLFKGGIILLFYYGF